MRRVWLSCVLMVMVLVMVGAARAQDVGAEEIRFAWSRDSSRLVFISNRAGGSDLFVVSATGGAAQKIAENVLDALWLPDNTSILYATGSSIYDDANNNIFKLNIETGVAEPLFEDDVAHYELLALAPNGNLLVYVISGEDTMASVALYDLTTQTSTPIVPEMKYVEATWSADNAYILIGGYETDASPSVSMVYDVAAGRLLDELVTNPLVHESLRFGAWSPDNTRLVFGAWQTPDIYIIDIQTAELTHLATVGGEITKIEWVAPDRILYLQDWWNNDYEDIPGAGIHSLMLDAATPEHIVDGVSTWFIAAPDKQRAIVQSTYAWEYFGVNQPRALEILDLTTNAIIEVNTFDTNSRDMRWSPDSTHIAAALCVDGDYDVIVIDALTGDFINVTPDDAYSVDEPPPSECLGFG